MDIRMYVLKTEGDYLVFFFSSRRRHTRLQGDWSSDVCSSDLCRALVMPGTSACGLPSKPASLVLGSEERRVEKECRSRWAPDHLKKKKKEDNHSSQIENKL